MQKIKTLKLGKMHGHHFFCWKIIKLNDNDAKNDNDRNDDEAFEKSKAAMFFFRSQRRHFGSITSITRGLL